MSDKERNIMRMALETLIGQVCDGRYLWQGCSGPFKRPRTGRTCARCWTLYRAWRADVIFPVGTTFHVR